MKVFRSVAAIVVWFGLILQYGLMVQGQTPDIAVYRTANFLSYFTILSNLLAAISLTMPTIWPTSRIGMFFARPGVRTAVTLYMSVTAATYIAILAALWKPQGWQWVADTTLHYVAPALILLDWLLFTPKGAVRWSSVPLWLIFPLGYGVYSIVRGPIASFYPYPFLDASVLGMSKVMVNMAAMSALFAILGVVLVLADRALRPRP